MALMGIKDNTSTALLQHKYLNHAITATATIPSCATIKQKRLDCDKVFARLKANICRNST